eukprot:scaffold1949_cov348-Pavlova_lutheri.AAC.11
MLPSECKDAPFHEGGWERSLCNVFGEDSSVGRPPIRNPDGNVRASIDSGRFTCGIGRGNACLP